MYVTGLGIVYWTSVQDSDLVRGGRRETLAINDTMLIETVTIPGTSYRRGVCDTSIFRIIHCSPFDCENIHKDLLRKA